MKREIAVIGAGLGGLSAAIRLAAQGHMVTVFEQNVSPGGKMGEISTKGFRFDTGPSLLTLPQVIDDLFIAAGEKREDYLEFISVDPICRYFWGDGTTMDAHQEPEKMKQALAALSPEDAENYPAYFQYSRRIHDLTAAVFLHSAIHEPGQLLTGENLKRFLHIFEIDPLRTMHRSISSYFEDPRIIQLFDRFATYNGSDPYQAPATLNIIPYVEIGLGAYYVKGGMYRIVEALMKLCTRLDITVNLKSAVKRIIYEGREVKGLDVDGNFLPFDKIVCNMDVPEAYRVLIDPDCAETKRLEKLEPSLSGMVFLWGVEGQHSQLSHHNIFFSEDYRAEFNQIFEQRRAPDDPTVYLSVTSKQDAAHAPAGCENWFLLLNMPYQSEGQDWDNAVEQMRAAIHKKLRQQGIDVRGRIKTETVFTPEYFHQQFGSSKGSLYGLSSNSKMSAFRRPANRSKKIEGLFFVGGSTHPGGGIPLVLLSGKHVAGMIGSADNGISHSRGYQDANKFS